MLNLKVEFMPLKTDRRRAGWGVFPLLTVLAAVMVAVGIMPIFTGSPKTQAEEVVECNTVYGEEDRELTIPINIAPGSNNKVKRFSFDGLTPGEKVTGFEFRNTTRAFTSSSVSLIVHNRSGELSDIPSLSATGINQYVFKSYNGQLSDGGKTLTVTLPSATAVAYPQGPGISGRIQIELPNTDTNKSHYEDVIAKVQTEREECTTKTVTPSTSEEPSSVEPTPTTPDQTPSTPGSPTSVEPEPTTTTPATSQVSPSSPSSEPTLSNPTGITSAVSPVPSSTRTTTSTPTTTVNPQIGTGLTPSPIRLPRGDEMGLRVRARAFPNDPNSYARGVKFQVYTAELMGPDGRNNVFNAEERGPVAKVQEPWASCVTGDNGECVIYYPRDWAMERYTYVVQENAHPGSFHVDNINWGKYGNFNKRTSASMPSMLLQFHQNYSLLGTIQDMAKMNNVPELRGFGASVQSLENPSAELARKCQVTGGPTIALVLDKTASIRKESQWPEQYKDAVYGPNGLLNSLIGTGASVAFFPFAEGAETAGTFPDPVSVDRNYEIAKANATKALGSEANGTFTNWQAGLESVLNSGRHYDQVIFVTDGDANTWESRDNAWYGGDDKDIRVNIDGSVRGVEAGIYAANELKAKGMRVVSIGVASAENAPHWNGANQLKAVSGQEYGVDYFGTDWGLLAATLRAAASQVTCQIDFEVNKVVVGADGKELEDQSAARGWTMGLDVSGIPDPKLNAAEGGEQPPFGYLSGDANQRLDSPRGSASGQTYGSPARIRWTLTQYADPLISNTTAMISEDVTSKRGYEFDSSLSRYEVRDTRTGVLKRQGTLSNPSQQFTGLKPGDKVVVSMVNRVVPEIVVQKDLPNGRKNQSDQFTLSVSKVTGAQGSAYVAQKPESVTTQGTEKGLQKTSNDQTLQAGPVKLDPNTLYLIREEAAGDTKLSDYGTTLKCVGADALPVDGSTTVWQVKTKSAVSTNITCTFTNTPVQKSSIAWKKVDNEGKLLACSQWMLTRTKDENGKEVKGQQWAVNDTAPDCTYDNTGLAQKEDMNPAAGSFKVADLPLGTYVIEEVRAPNGYGVNNQRKSAAIELTAANASAGVTITDPFVNYPDVTTPGTLPRTGGIGIGTTAGFASVIIALGCVMLRRRDA